MDPMMIGIAAVVIAIILAGALAVVKRRQCDDRPVPSAHRPKTLAEQQRDLELQRQQTAAPVAPAAIPSAEAALTSAQHCLDQQDYLGAERVLRQAIKQHPMQPNLHFSLLNTFALAKDYDKFDQCYPNVLKLHDVLTTQQANSLKRLIDAERRNLTAQSVAQPAAIITPTAMTAPVIASDVLAFDIPVPTPVTPVATPTASDDFAFDLDIGATPSTATQPTTMPTAVTPSPLEGGFDFDLDMEMTPAGQAASASPVIAEEKKHVVLPDRGELTIDGLDAPITKPVEPVVAAISPVDASLDFDFNDLSLDTFATPATPSTNDTPTDFALDDGLDMGLDIGLDSPASSKAEPIYTTPVSTPLPTSDAAMDFEIVFDDASSVAPAPTSPTVTDDTLSETTTSAATAAPKAGEDAIDIAFDFDLETPKPAKPVTSPTAAIPEKVSSEFGLIHDDHKKINDDTFAQLDDFFASQASSPVTPETVAPTTHAPVLDSPVMATKQASREAQAESAAPVPGDLDTSFSNAFELLKDVDSDQINLELAEQYMTLGEYDGAKRLLNEVTAGNNPDYTALAERLLAKMG